MWTGLKKLVISFPGRIRVEVASRPGALPHRDAVLGCRLTMCGVESPRGARQDWGHHAKAVLVVRQTTHG